MKVSWSIIAIALGLSTTVVAGGCKTSECCDKEANKCRTGKDANQAYCSAQKAKCYVDAGLKDPFAG